ncbi:MAG: hypothetical protein HZA24_07615 [Nitrospirae bacterium]|nr:hypothetical protein [Nitrospirota bacterium]
MRRTLQGLVVAFFLALTVLPLVLTGGAELSEAEKRRLAPFPTLSDGLAVFPKGFEAWFNDHFGLRAPLVAAYNRVKVLALGVSTRPGVAIGDDGWLYYGGNAMTAYRGGITLPDAHLEQWRAYLEGMRDWLAERGVRYLFVVTPAKQEVYPEHLPARFAPVGPSVREQFMAALAARSDVPVVDLTPALLAAKGDGDLFMRTDSHWNGRGAYVGYAAVMERLSGWFPELAPLPLERFAVAREPAAGGDLAQLFNLNAAYADTRVTVTPADPSCARPEHFQIPLEADWATRRAPFRTRCGGAPPLRLVMLRDSFANDMIPLLAGHFQAAVYDSQANAQHPLEHSFPLLNWLAADVRPAVVIDQLAARKLTMPAPFVPELRMATLRRRYREAPLGRRWLSPGGADAPIRISGPVTLAPHGALRVGGPGAALLLPGLDLPADAWPVLRVALAAPAETVLSVAWRRPGGAGFEPAVQARLAAGPNDVFLPLPVRGPVAELRLSPGTAPGDYALRLIEGRGVAENFAALPGAGGGPVPAVGQDTID